MIYPSTPLADRPIEFVFEGKGVLFVPSPDETEAGQLELFTGTRNLLISFQEAVFVVSDEAVVAKLRPGMPHWGPFEHQKRGEALWYAWKNGPVRRCLDLESTMLRSALGDVSLEKYFLGLFKSEGADFFYEIDPEADEQITLGSFRPLRASTSERRQIERSLADEKENHHLVGLDVIDLGRFTVWLSAPLNGPDGALSSTLGS